MRFFYHCLQTSNDGYMIWWKVNEIESNKKLRTFFCTYYYWPTKTCLIVPPYYVHPCFCSILKVQSVFTHYTCLYFWSGSKDIDFCPMRNEYQKIEELWLDQITSKKWGVLVTNLYLKIGIMCTKFVHTTKLGFILSINLRLLT